MLQISHQCNCGLPAHLVIIFNISIKFLHVEYLLEQNELAPRRRKWPKKRIPCEQVMKMLI